MSIVGIGDPMTLANWERWYRSDPPTGPQAVWPHRPLPLPVVWEYSPHVPAAGDPPPPDIGTGHYQPPPVAQGWQCPVCKTVYAPFVTQCECDIPAPIPDDFVGLGKPNSVTPVRIRVTDKEAAE